MFKLKYVSNLICKQIFLSLPILTHIFEIVIIVIDYKISGVYNNYSLLIKIELLNN